PDLRHRSGRLCRHGGGARPDRRTRQRVRARDAHGEPRLAAAAAAAPGARIRDVLRRCCTLSGARPVTARTRWSRGEASLPRTDATLHPARYSGPSCTGWTMHAQTPAEPLRTGTAG